MLFSSKPPLTIIFLLTIIGCYLFQTDKLSAQDQYKIIRVKEGIAYIKKPTDSVLKKGQELSLVRKITGQPVILTKVEVVTIGVKYCGIKFKNDDNDLKWYKGDYLIHADESPQQQEVDNTWQDLQDVSHSNRGWALSAGFGSLGLGLQLHKSLLHKLNARIGVNTFSIGKDGILEDSDVTYNADLKLSSVAALFDWHPSAGGFRLSFGMIINKNKAELLVQPSKTFTVGGTTYTPAEIGSLTGTVEFNRLAPYFGIGWGNSVGHNKRAGVVFDIGTIYHNSPQVRMKATGFIAPTAEQAPDVQDDIKDFRFYPVITLGLTYKIFQ